MQSEKNMLPSAPNGGIPNIEYERFGHNTKIQGGGLCFLLCCFPWSMIYFAFLREEVTCKRCGAKVAPQGPID